MRKAYLARTAIRFVERIPSLVWAAWIVAVVVGTGMLALRGGPVGG